MSSGRLTQLPRLGTCLKVVLLLKPSLDSRPVTSVPPKRALLSKTAVGVLVERSNCGAGDLRGDADAPDHLGVGDEKSLQTQGKERVFQRVKQGTQQFPKRLSVFTALI